MANYERRRRSLLERAEEWHLKIARKIASLEKTLLCV